LAAARQARAQAQAQAAADQSAADQAAADRAAAQRVADGPARLEEPASMEEPAFHEEPAEPVSNEGLSIFGGVATTEATDDPPARGFDHYLRHRPQGDEPAAGSGSRSASGRVIQIGSGWNQPSAPPAVASEPAADSKPHPFGMRMRGILRGGDADDDGDARVSMRDLPPDVQVRFWRLRLIIMVIVGAVFAALTRSWEIALTLAILAGILDTVYRSRNAGNYVVAGPHPGARKHTRSQLARMQREGFYSLEDRPIPHSSEVIDHLVVGPSGVYAIDSEKWNPTLPIRTLNGKRLYLGPESQKDRLDHAAWEAAQASAILSEALGTEIEVRPALAIYGPKIPWDITTIRNVDVFTGQALRKYLKRRGRAKDGVVLLTSEEVRTICDTADRMLPAAGESSSAAAPVG
jgi:Nuclease-related domain